MTSQESISLTRDHRIGATGHIECRILEKEAIGFDHAQLGAWALGRWRLPESLVLAVRYHHEPRAVEEKADELTRLVWVTHLADVISHENGDDPGEIREIVARYADPLVAHHLPLGDGQLFEDLLPRVRDDLEIARQVFSETRGSEVATSQPSGASRATSTDSVSRPST